MNLKLMKVAGVLCNAKEATIEIWFGCPEVNWHLGLFMLTLIYTEEL